MRTLFAVVICSVIALDFVTRVLVTSATHDKVITNHEFESPSKNSKVHLQKDKITGLFGKYVEKKAKEKEIEVKSTVAKPDGSVQLDKANVRIVMIAGSDKGGFKVFLETKVANQKAAMFRNVTRGEKILGFDVVEITSNTVTFQKGSQKIRAIAFKSTIKEIS